MARGRMLSTDTSVDPELHSLSLASYALYLSCIPHLDRDGLIDAHPLKLVATAAPLRYEFRDNAAALINEWVELGLVIRYQVTSRQAVLFFKGFRRHQQGMEYGREPASRYAPPPGWTRTKEGLVPDDPELCFRLSESFHPKSAYRRLLIEVAGVDVPSEVPDTSRSVRDVNANVREHFAPKTNIREQNNDDDDDHTYIPTHPGFGKGGDARGGDAARRLSSALAEFDDDELRIGADGLAQLMNLADEFDGWARFISGATRDDLLLIIAWCTRWSADTPEQMERVNSYPALLRSKLRSREWPGLNLGRIDYAVETVQMALQMAIPEVEL